MRASGAHGACIWNRECGDGRASGVLRKRRRAAAPSVPLAKGAEPCASGRIPGPHLHDRSPVPRFSSVRHTAERPTMKARITVYETVIGTSDVPRMPNLKPLTM